MKYTPATISKAIVATILGAIGAATVAAGGPDLSVLDFGQWLGALGAGLTAGGAVFATPNKSGSTPVDQVLTNLPVVAEVANQAQADLEKVKKATREVLGDTSVLGPLAAQVIERAK